LIELRKRYSVFSTVDLKWLLVDTEQQAFIFQKIEENQKLIVVINTKAGPVTLKIPEELINKKYKELFTDKVVELKEVLHLNKFEFRLLLG
jgi:glycosidase